jgi:hypothetical protein
MFDLGRPRGCWHGPSSLKDTEAVPSMGLVSVSQRKEHRESKDLGSWDVLCDPSNQFPIFGPQFPIGKNKRHTL